MFLKNRISFAAVLLLVALIILGAVGCGGETDIQNPEVTEDQGWKPEREMKIIVPYSSGASNDTISRLMAKYLTDEFGVPVVVENITGAGNLVGIQTALSAKNDGLTILNISTPGVELNTFQQGEIDMSTDFSMLAGVQADPQTWLVAPDSKFDTFDQMIEAAKASPGKVTAGQTGPWSAAYLHLMKLQRELGVEITFVPFDGGSEALAAVLGGHIDAQIATVGRNYLKHQDGEIKMLVQANKGKHEAAPTIPTIEEVTGAANYDNIIRGFAIRSDVPDNIKQALIEAMEKICKNEDYIAEFQKSLGNTNTFIPGPEFDKIVKENLKDIGDFFGDIVKK